MGQCGVDKGVAVFLQLFCSDLRSSHASSMRQQERVDECSILFSKAFKHGAILEVIFLSATFIVPITDRYAEDGYNQKKLAPLHIVPRCLQKLCIK